MPLDLTYVTIHTELQAQWSGGKVLRSMTFKNVLHVSARERPFVLIVEPWADEFTIAVGDDCKVVALNPGVSPTFEVEPCRGCDLIIYVNESGSTFEFWRSGVREFWTSVAIPG